jgi:hypothetical protein
MRSRVQLITLIRIRILHFTLMRIWGSQNDTSKCAYFDQPKGIKIKNCLREIVTYFLLSADPTKHLVRIYPRNVFRSGNGVGIGVGTE